MLEDGRPWEFYELSIFLILPFANPCEWAAHCLPLVSWPRIVPMSCLQKMHVPLYFTMSFNHHSTGSNPSLLQPPANSESTSRITTEFTNLLCSQRTLTSVLTTQVQLPGAASSVASARARKWRDMLDDDENSNLSVDVVVAKFWQCRKEW